MVFFYWGGLIFRCVGIQSIYSYSILLNKDFPERWRDQRRMDRLGNDDGSGDCSIRLIDTWLIENYSSFRGYFQYSCFFEKHKILVFRIEGFFFVWCGNVRFLCDWLNCTIEGSWELFVSVGLVPVYIGWHQQRLRWVVSQASTSTTSLIVTFIN